VRVFKVDEKDFNVKTECPRADTLDDTDDKFMGEICWRGRANMMGYLAQPDLGPDTWLRLRRKPQRPSIMKDGFTLETRE